jgi:hypothetical protein
MNSDKQDKNFKEFFYHDCEAIEDNKIKAVYLEYKRAGRDLILNQIIPKLSKLEIYELELNELTFYDFADPEITKDKVKEIIEFCISKGLFNTNKITFWNIRVLEHKLNRLSDNKKQSDKKFNYWSNLKNDPERINPKYKAEIERIIEILQRPLYSKDTAVIPQYKNNDNFDTAVIQR